MKKLLFILFLGTLASCEEVIELELENSEPRLVVEGTISEGELATIQLTLTSDYFDDINPQVVENATVSITDVQLGQTEGLIHVGNRVYQGQTIVGQMSKEYRLEVRYNGVDYESITTMHPAPEIGSVNFNQVSGGGVFIESGLVTLIEFESMSSNAYYSIVFESSTAEIPLGYNLEVAIDSSKVSRFINPRVLVQEGDSLSIHVRSIDKSHYDYLIGMNDLAGNNNQGGGATPYNPVSRFEPEVLGYFYAYSQASIDTVAIP